MQSKGKIHTECEYLVMVNVGGYLSLVVNAMEQNLQMFLIMVYVRANQDIYKLLPKF